MEDEIDVARYEVARKTSAYATALVYTLSFLDEAVQSAERGDSRAASIFVEAAWAIYHGDGETCSLFYNNDRRKNEFNPPAGGDVNEFVTSAFETALSDGVTEESATNLLREVVLGSLLTYLRAAIRYATKLDAHAAAGDEDEVREYQYEGLSYFNVVEPIVADLAPDAANAIVSAFTQTDGVVPADVDLETYEPVLDDVKEAVASVLESVGLTPDLIGAFDYEIDD